MDDKYILGISVSQDGEHRKGYLKSVADFFKNPIVVFSASFLFALFAVLFGERYIQVYGIVSICIIYSVFATFYAIWKENVSSERLREKNLDLQRKVEVLDDDNRKLKKERDALEKEVPKVIAYSLVEKHIKIHNEKGDAHFSMTYHGTNVSERPLRKVRHFVSTKEKLTKDKLSNIKFNTEDILPVVENIQFGSEWRNNIFLAAAEPVSDGTPVVTHYEAELEKEYADGFKLDGTTFSFHEVSLKTDRFLVEIIAPKGFYLANPQFDIRDVFGDIEVYREKDRVTRECPPLPKEGRKKIIWDISNPRLSYRYILEFGMIKKVETV